MLHYSSPIVFFFFSISSRVHLCPVHLPLSCFLVFFLFCLNCLPELWFWISVTVPRQVLYKPNPFFFFFSFLLFCPFLGLAYTKLLMICFDLSPNLPFSGPWRFSTSPWSISCIAMYLWENCTYDRPPEPDLQRICSHYPSAACRATRAEDPAHWPGGTSCCCWFPALVPWSRHSASTAPWT